MPLPSNSVTSINLVASIGKCYLSAIICITISI
nr:MAG TPA: hypothetical protein [Caudoviricetes sp.]